MNSLNDENVAQILQNAISSDRGFAGEFTLSGEAEAEIVRQSSGDARRALNTL